jgi:hypothetical protein
VELPHRQTSPQPARNSAQPRASCPAERFDRKTVDAHPPTWPDGGAALRYYPFGLSSPERDSGAVWNCLQRFQAQKPYSHILQRDSIMSLGTILVIILIIFLLGGFSGRFGGPGYGYGHRGNGLIGVILIIVVVLLLTGRL